MFASFPGIIPYVPQGNTIRTEKQAVKATTAIAFGDTLKRTSGASTVEPALTNTATEFVYFDAARASGDTGTPIKDVIRITEDQQFIFPVEAYGTTTVVKGMEVDLNSPNGVNLNASTNDNVIVDEAYAYDAAGTTCLAVVGRYKI